MAIMQNADLAGWLRLSLTSGVGNETARRLLARFGLPQSVFDQSSSALRQCVSAVQASALATPPPGFEAQLEATRQWLDPVDAARAAARAIVTLGDAAYPPALLAIEDPPLMLYLMGAALHTVPDGLWQPARSIGMVGSRNPTPQGASNAHAFGKFFSQAGLTVVSGLALGIDAAAHEGALDGSTEARTDSGHIPTIAVVGTGLDRVYPKRHLALAHRIARCGLLVSEYPLGTPAIAANFPRRNRLISGLSQGVLVVEAALQSGSLITARMASEQGKEVFAIPGSIHAPQSRGCHWLLKQGAKLVETGQDVLEELRLPSVAPNAAPDAPTTQDETAPTAAAHPLLEHVGFDPVGLDTLLARTGLDTANLQVQLLELELGGQIARLPGGRFQRTGLT